jgi:hypothetical protein
VVDLLLCDRHWSEIRDQAFPNRCPECGDVTETLEELVTTSMPIGADATTTLETAKPRRPPTRVPLTGAFAATSDGDVALRACAPAAEFGSSCAEAERHWIQTREHEAVARCEQEYGSRTRELHAGLASARRAGDGERARDLAVELRQVESDRRDAEWRWQEQLRRDRQAWALWRQTQDGRAFISWADTTFDLVAWIGGVEAAWEEAWAEALAEIPAVERQAHRARRWIPRTRGQRRGKTLRDVGTGVAAAGLLLGLIVSPFWDAAAAVGVGLTAYGLAAGHDGDWTARNKAEGRRQSESRAERFGFDPLAEPDRRPPSWAAGREPGEVIDYASALLDSIVSGFTEHPAPEDLPQAVAPRPADPAQFRVRPLQNVLRDAAGD